MLLNLLGQLLLFEPLAFDRLDLLEGLHRQNVAALGDLNEAVLLEVANHVVDRVGVVVVLLQLVDLTLHLVELF